MTLLGLRTPVLAAPMAGSAGTPALALAAAAAGSLGFLAGGYKTPAALAREMAAVEAAGVDFGVNLFAPNPLAVARDAFARYAGELEPDARRYGIELDSGVPREDDDGWQEKLELMLARAPAIVSFTFGLPDAGLVARLRAAGSITMQTVTSAEEARAAAELGFDALAVQSQAAGGHYGTLTPAKPPPALELPDLLRSVAAVTALPLVGAGGIADAQTAREAIAAGAEAVAVGTALLLAPESATGAAHRAALSEPTRESVITRAFTGRPARGLRNGFIERHEPTAPLGYPAIHHLTAPLRRVAAEAGDPECVHLWAGTGFRNARAAPAAQIIEELAGEL